MILVVLGTWQMPFTRPLIEIEQAVLQGRLPEPVVVQSGKTAYSSPVMQLVPFFTGDDLDKLYQQASLIICQAGVGSIMLALKHRKKVIAIARRATFDEHIDDHQLEILEAFSRVGAIMPWRGDGDLCQLLGRIEDFVPTGYRFGPERISRAILDYLDSTIDVLPHKPGN